MNEPTRQEYGPYPGLEYGQAPRLESSVRIDPVLEGKVYMPDINPIRTAALLLYVGDDSSLVFELMENHRPVPMEGDYKFTSGWVYLINKRTGWKVSFVHDMTVPEGSEVITIPDNSGGENPTPPPGTLCPPCPPSEPIGPQCYDGQTVPLQFWQGDPLPTVNLQFVVGSGFDTLTIPISSELSAMIPPGSYEIVARLAWDSTSPVGPRRLTWVFTDKLKVVNEDV